MFIWLVSYITIYGEMSAMMLVPPCRLALYHIVLLSPDLKQ